VAGLPLPGARPGAPQGAGIPLALRPASPGELAPLAAEQRLLRYRQCFDGAPYEMLEGRDGDHLLRYGTRALFHLSADARVLRCAPADAAEPSWQRVLLDTVLWSASLLRGFELLHMSAVQTPAGVVAVAARSGGGKTSLAAELLRRGATLFSDDILAVAEDSRGAVVHPGPPLLNLPNAFPVASLAGARVLAELGDERWVAVQRPPPRPGPLAAVVLLEREPGAELRCEPLAATTIALLPYAVGFPHLADRARRRFELLGAAASAARVLRLGADPAVPVATLANLLAERVPIQ
jgi:hypothetical protein